MNDWMRALREEADQIDGRRARFRWMLGAPATVVAAATTKGRRVRTLQDLWAAANVAMATLIVVVGVVVGGWTVAMIVFATALLLQGVLSLRFGRSGWATRWTPVAQGFVLLLAAPALIVSVVRNVDPATVDPEFGPMTAMLLMAGLAALSLVNWRQRRRPPGLEA